MSTLKGRLSPAAPAAWSGWPTPRMSPGAFGPSSLISLRRPPRSRNRIGVRNVAVPELLQARRGVAFCAAKSRRRGRRPRGTFAEQSAAPRRARKGGWV